MGPVEPISVGRAATQNPAQSEVDGAGVSSLGGVCSDSGTVLRVRGRGVGVVVSVCLRIGRWRARQRDCISRADVT